MGKEIIESTFRFSYKTLSFNNNQNVSLNIPLTHFEKLMETPSSGCVIQSSNNQKLKVALLSMNSQLYAPASQTNIISNPLRLELIGLNNNNITNLPSSFEFTLINNSPEVYYEENNSLYFNVTCESGEYSRHEKECPGGGNKNITMVFICNGTSVSYSKRCPKVIYQPSCAITMSQSMSGFYNCSLLSFTSQLTICKCNLTLGKEESINMTRTREINRNRNRHLESSQSSSWSYVEVKTVGETMVKEFGDTLLTVDDVNKNIVENTLVIVLMYGVLWGVGLTGVLFCWISQWNKNNGNGLNRLNRLKKSKILSWVDKNNKSEIEGEKEIKQEKEFKKILMGYVDEVFPKVFHPQSYFTRMYREIRQHHRYYLLISGIGGNKYGEENENNWSKMILTCFQLLTVQTMLMFMLAVFYDLQVSHN